MNYTESKQKLDNLRRMNEMLFRMAISHLMDVGIRHLTDENIEKTCVDIMKEDDSHSFMTNKFQCDLVMMAGTLAKIDHIHLLNYISKEMYYHVEDNAFSYQRAIGLLKRCVELIDEHHCEEYSEVLEDLYYIGFHDDEIEALGYGYLLEEEEE